ncbi:hypothetical protein Angca_002125, partial [Angiostrongylus cantonensis]
FQMKHGLNTIHRTELQLIVHTAILFLVLTSLITFWHYHQYLFPNSVWTVFAINMYWIMY